jgi:site-specific DNA recombinase
MNGIIYCRVSSKEQIEGTSLESQQAACLEYADAKNIGVRKIFVEQGESAKFADRTQLLELLDYCRVSKGQIQMLLVWKLDRFSRNVEDHFSIKATLAKYGVRIVSVTEPIDANPEGRLMETILAGFAQFDNDIRAARTVQGMRRKIHDGIFPWMPPLGYLSAATGEKKNASDIPDPARFNLLQRAWRQFAAGGYSKRDIRRLLASWGVGTRKGRAISDQSLDNMFANPFYAGILVDPWSGKEFPGQHLAMVTPDEFARIQHILSGKNRSLVHNAYREDFPLRGFARCAECRHPLTGAFSRGRRKRYAYYNCHNRSCRQRGKTLPVPAIDNEFKAFLADIAPKTECSLTLEEVIRQCLAVRETGERTRRDRQKKRVEQINRELTELVSLRTQAQITDEEFDRHRAHLLDQRNAIVSAAARLPYPSAEIMDKLDDLKTPLTQLPKAWEKLKGPRSLRFDRLVLPAGFIAGTIRTAQIGLLFRLSGGVTPGHPHAVPLDTTSSNQLMQEIMDFWGLLFGPEEEKIVKIRPIRRRYRKRDPVT